MPGFAMNKDVINEYTLILQHGFSTSEIFWYLYNINRVLQA